jgi:outer membrane receptor protein involved in Fe transport
MKTVGDKETRFLPSINATFNLTDKINIRASYSKTAIRPDFRETGLFAFYSYELDGYISGEQVVSTIVDNTDLRIEWYPSAGEIISLTGYYKYLDKPIELTEFQRDLGYYKYANMESATNLGLEMEVRKNLSFIADKEWLTDFFVYANGTLLKSNVKVLTPYDTRVQPNGDLERYQERREDQDRPLLGQSPWLINLGLSYWGDYYGATASFNYRGFRTNLTSSYIQGVEFELAPKQLDFQVYGRFLKKKLEAKLNLSNLLNDWTRYYRNNNLYDKDQIGDSDLISKGDTNYNKDDGDQILY